MSAEALALALLLAVGAVPLPGDELLLAESVPRGHGLAPESLPRQADGSLAEVPEAFRSRLARRHLVRGSRVTLLDFAAPPVVLRNQVVTVIVRKGALLVSLQARALGDASEGDAVKVLNRTAGRTLDTVATGPGQVELRIP